MAFLHSFTQFSELDTFPVLDVGSHTFLILIFLLRVFRKMSNFQ